MMMMIRKKEKKTISLPFIIYLAICCGFLMIVSHNELANYRFDHSAEWSLRAQPTLSSGLIVPESVPHRESDNLSQTNSSLELLIIYLPLGFGVGVFGFFVTGGTSFGDEQSQILPRLQALNGRTASSCCCISKTEIMRCPPFISYRSLHPSFNQLRYYSTDQHPVSFSLYVGMVLLSVYLRPSHMTELAPRQVGLYELPCLNLQQWPSHHTE